MNDRNRLSIPTKSYRVVQWTAGRIGQSAMRAVIRHPDLELVGLHVHSARKEGCDAGELAGLSAIGVKATRSIEEIIDISPDCVLYMQQGYDADDMCVLLEAGINLITTRSEFFYAKLMESGLRDRIETACCEGNSTLFATGSSPGFSTEVLPIAMAYMSRRVDCLTVDEFADIPASTSPLTITEVMGYGQPVPEEFSPQMLAHMSGGFAQSLGAVLDGMGIAYEEFTARGESAVANSRVVLPHDIEIEPGTVAAQRISVAAVRDGKPVMQFRANWYCTQDIDADWELADNGWRLTMEGDTPMRVDISFPHSGEQPYADHMSGLTAHPAVNAVAYVCEADAGIRTNLDLPLIVPRFA